MQLSPPERTRYLAAMDQWWAQLAASLSPQQISAAQRAYRTALGQLNAKGAVSAAAEAKAGATSVASRWREDRT